VQTSCGNEFAVVHVAQFGYVEEHLPRKDNIIANQLTRNNITQTIRSKAGLSKWPTLVPISVLHMISPNGPDCVFSNFLKLLKETL